MGIREGGRIRFGDLNHFGGDVQTSKGTLSLKKSVHKTDNVPRATANVQKMDAFFKFEK